ncbi:MAG: glycosyltransferase [Deltaproteobacteria bacterium]|nr:glycosyltransferase [Deltaproteobacteria bacterium]
MLKSLTRAQSQGISSSGQVPHVSDIPANKEVALPDERYFTCGDVDDLRLKMELFIEKGLSDTKKQDMRRLIAEKYDWEKIVEQTIAVYNKTVTS